MILIMQILELTSQVYEYFPRLWVNTFINLFLVQNYKLGTNHFFQSSEAHALETKIRDMHISGSSTKDRKS